MEMLTYSEPITLDASLGVEKEILGYNYDPAICIELNQSEEMPDEAILKIENASKSWDQIFSFEMK